VSTNTPPNDLAPLNYYADRRALEPNVQSASIVMLLSFVRRESPAERLAFSPESSD
jgi:hypothetical protein